MPEFIPLEPKGSKESLRSEQQHSSQHSRQHSRDRRSTSREAKRKHRRSSREIDSIQINYRDGEQLHEYRKQTVSLPRHSRSRSPISYHQINRVQEAGRISERYQDFDRIDGNSSRNHSLERSNSRSIFSRIGSKHLEREDDYHRRLESSNTRHSPIIFNRRDEIEERNLNPGMSSYENNANHSILKQQHYNDRALYDESRRYNVVIRTNQSHGQGNGQGGSGLSRSVVFNSEDSGLEMFNRIKLLENREQELLTHCEGLRSTVELYNREIMKLENIITNWSQEISEIKRELNAKFSFS